MPASAAVLLDQVGIVMTYLVMAYIVVAVITNMSASAAVLVDQVGIVMAYVVMAYIVVAVITNMLASAAMLVAHRFWGPRYAHDSLCCSRIHTPQRHCFCCYLVSVTSYHSRCRDN